MKMEVQLEEKIFNKLILESKNDKHNAAYRKQHLEILGLKF